ncbi:hypothetical protein CEN48_09325, partial [Fischerella thermalis CCMEE 5282]|uniref:hypothetical protein n=1 Tax=Fischerella thermalis TaxID=372787 RepID=UPI000CBCB5AF
QVRLITYDIILMQLGIGQEIFPITHYQLPITGLHRYDKSSNEHDITCNINLIFVQKFILSKIT